MNAPLQGDTGGHIGTAPTKLHQTARCAITSSHCTFDSSKPHGVPLPHRGYTFDSAGLASATQPTLGNDASEGATPLGRCTLSHRTSLPHAANDFPTRKLKKVQCRWYRFPSTTLPRVASYRRQPWADKSTIPMVLVHVHRFHQPTNKTTHTHRGRKCIAHSCPHYLK